MCACTPISPRPRTRTAICQEIHKCRPLDYLEDCGWLNERTWLAHGIHFNSDEIVRLARAGTTVSHCPCSNQTLASGTCPVCAMEEAGVRIGLGVDGSASNDASNLMQEVRAAFLLQRGRYGVGKVSHRDALRWATKGSAACVGRTDIGEIAVGALADLALFKLDELRFSGSGDPLAALVLCGAHRADRVMVGGRWIVENGANSRTRPRRSHAAALGCGAEIAGTSVMPGRVHKPASPESIATDQTGLIQGIFRRNRGYGFRARA